MIFFFLIFLFHHCEGYAAISFTEKLNEDSVIIISTGTLPDSNLNSILYDSANTYKHENKKLIAAILSFPLPFGILGLHRIYLGTKPYIPFVYIGTAGGCFGILPLIDFIAILSAKKGKIKHFENNFNVFMWLH